MPTIREMTKASALTYGDKTPDGYRGNDPMSTLHNTYSLNGQPPMPGLPNPSRLSNGLVVKEKYLDNPPT